MSITSKSERKSPTETDDVTGHVRRVFHFRLREIGALLAETVGEWNDDNVPRLAASLAFYTLLSMAPVLVVVVAVAAFVFGSQAAEGRLAWEIQGLVGREGARAIQNVIHNAYKPATGLIAGLVSLATLLWGSSAVAVELRDALNMIWHVPAGATSSRTSSVLRFMKERVYGFALVLGAGFLLLVSLVLNAVIAAMGDAFGSSLSVPESALQVLTSVVSLIVTTFLFAAIYKFLPDVPLKWSDVIVGAAFTSFIFTLGKQLIGIYLGKAGIGSAYGAAGSLVIALIWVYYSAQLFFLGAEFTKVYTQRVGSHFQNRLVPQPAKPENSLIDPAVRGPVHKIETL